MVEFERLYDRVVRKAFSVVKSGGDAGAAEGGDDEAGAAAASW